MERFLSCCSSPICTVVNFRSPGLSNLLQARELGSVPSFRPFLAHCVRCIGVMLPARSTSDTDAQISAHDLRGDGKFITRRRDSVCNNHSSEHCTASRRCHRRKLRTYPILRLFNFTSTVTETAPPRIFITFGVHLSRAFVVCRCGDQITPMISAMETSGYRIKSAAFLD